MVVGLAEELVLDRPSARAGRVQRVARVQHTLSGQRAPMFLKQSFAPARARAVQCHCYSHSFENMAADGSKNRRKLEGARIGLGAKKCYGTRCGFSFSFSHGRMNE